MTRVGIISGTGAYDWPGLEHPEAHTARTPHGDVEVTVGAVGGVETVHISRHGPSHRRLSNHVTYKANLSALRGLEVSAVVSLTVCGALDPQTELGSLVVFDDFFFPTNRLPDGSLCTWFDTPGSEGRGHWIFDRPFDPTLRQAMLDAARAARLPVRDGGCYGHVDGPRFNSRAEIAALRQFGVTAVSQTAGPEVVLAGEAELPMVLVGYLTDYANGVSPTAETVDALIARAAASAGSFGEIIRRAAPRIGAAGGVGTVYRFAD